MSTLMPGAKQIAGALNGGSMTSGPPRVVWHTTESAPGTMSGNVAWLLSEQTAPHLIWDPSTGEIGQFTPADVAARALMHPAGTPETNRDGSSCIQIEVIGHAAVPFTAGPLIGLAQIMAWLDTFGAKRMAPATNLRLTWAAWAAYPGHCGHIHVPGNDHVDPGAIDWDVLLGVEHPAQPLPAPTPSPTVNPSEDDMARLFACTDPKADPRLGVISAANGPRWVKNGTESTYLIKSGLVENATPDPKSPADMVALLGPVPH